MPALKSPTEKEIIGTKIQPNLFCQIVRVSKMLASFHRCLRFNVLSSQAKVISQLIWSQVLLQVGYLGYNANARGYHKKKKVFY